MRILLVEDDPLLGDGLVTAMQNDGYTVDWLKDGKHALQAIKTEDFNLVLLDLGLPGMDGLEVIRQTRKKSIDVPILILTARDAIDDRVTGLDLGADDYMTKPFDVNELHARLRSLIRRSHGRASPLLERAGIRINPSDKSVSYRDKPVSLSSKEYSVLLYLVENADRVTSRAQLEEQLYGWDQAIDSNALEVHIHNLRKKLDSAIIKTIRGIGYQLQDPKGL
ncbi:MAG: response regulator transcription factor [Gammaproteobacteria bacterium]|nr:response regulator transcription factor [Gammaproteobacteria bacterium]